MGSPCWSYVQQATINIFNIFVGSLKRHTNKGGSSSTPLPIDLQSFKADLNGNTVDVSWKTATEVSNDYFIIEKSFDGHNWTKATEIKSVVNSNLLTNYSWIDLSNYTGLCYYKLTQVDKDGTQKSFDMVSVLKNQANILHEILLYPNPSSDHFSLEYFSENEDEFTVIIDSDNGQEVYNQKHKINKGENIFHISSADFADGLYFVVIENTHGLKVTKKIIKE